MRSAHKSSNPFCHKLSGLRAKAATSKFMQDRNKTLQHLATHERTQKPWLRAPLAHPSRSGISHVQQHQLDLRRRQLDLKAITRPAIQHREVTLAHHQVAAVVHLGFTAHLAASPASTGAVTSELHAFGIQQRGIEGSEVHALQSITTRAHIATGPSQLLLGCTRKLLDLPEQLFTSQHEGNRDTNDPHFPTITAPGAVLAGIA